MKFKKIGLGILLPVAIWVLAIVVIASVKRPVVVPDEEPLVTVPLVDSTKIRHYTDTFVIEADGVVVPFREIQLASQVSGRIEYKSENCRAGRKVKEGEELFRIDSQDYELAVEQLKRQQHQAEIDVEDAKLEITKATDLLKLANEDFKLAAAEHTRLKKLRESSNVISISDVERAQRAELTAQNSVVQYNAQLSSARQREYKLISGKELTDISLQKANLDLARTSVKAPVDGVIIRELVEEDSFAQPGTNLVMIEDTKQGEIRANLKMDDLFWILGGASQLEEAAGATLPPLKVDVSYKFSGSRDLTIHWEGVLNRFDGRGLDATTRTVPIIVIVPNPEAEGFGGIGALVRGMFVELEIGVENQDGLVLIPRNSLTSSNEVYVVTKAKESNQDAGIPDGRLPGIYGKVENVTPLHSVKIEEQYYWVVDTKSNDLTVDSVVVTRRLFGVDVGAVVAFQASQPNAAKAGMVEESVSK
ncbi:MAG: HlyD family efflux transporter periplasmic adaptor subunit [Planctomycetota bacterium]|nr:HlyD family efflux transporter periplasmic adaptor subunit [Planctomycetota bacterium]